MTTNKNMRPEKVRGIVVIVVVKDHQLTVTNSKTPLLTAAGYSDKRALSGCCMSLGALNRITWPVDASPDKSCLNARVAILMDKTEITKVESISRLLSEKLDKGVMDEVMSIEGQK